MKLRNFLILTFFLLALAPVLLFRAWPHSAVLESEFEEVHERHLLLARNLAAALERYHRDVTATFQLLVRTRAEGGTASQAADILENLHFRHVCIVDRMTGRKIDEVSLARTPCPDVVPSERFEMLRELAVEGEVVFGPVLAGPDGENVMHVVMLTDAGELAIGAIQTTYFRELGEAIAFGVRGHAAIVDHLGNVLSHPLPSWVAARRNIAGVSAVQRMMRGETGVEVFYSPALKGDMVAGFTSVEPVGWGVMIPQPVAELQAKAANAHRSALYVQLIGVSVALALALVLSVLTSRPLEAITRSAERVARGEFALPGTPRALRALPTEFRELHRSFHKMVLQLRDRTVEVHRLAFVDGITGLANREFFRRRVEGFIGGSGSDDKAAILFLDLDGFKAVNDSKGHDIGDLVLCEVAERLTRVVKVPAPGEHLEDLEITVGDFTSGCIARLGGDEFAVFLPGAGAGRAKWIADQVLFAFQSAFASCPDHIMLGASIGIAHFPKDATTFSALLKAADTAMYEAKRAGKNQVKVFATEKSTCQGSRKSLADDLFSSHFNAQLDMRFQPTYRLSDMSVGSVEGLIRWQHPTKGLLSPHAFLGLAADLGLLRQIDQMAFERSTRAMSELVGKGVQVPELSLNLSMERLADHAFVEQILHRLPLPFDLSVELAGSTFADTVDQAAHWSIDRLKEAGVAIVLDDFGSSHASIASLLDLSPKRIKIDAGLIGRMQDGQPITSIVKSLIDMAHGLGIEVMAKGVEKMAHVDLLRDMGADHVQGYALNGPMTKMEIGLHLPRKNETSRASA